MGCGDELREVGGIRMGFLDYLRICRVFEGLDLLR